MGLSKSTYYYEISKEDVVMNKNEELTKEIKDVFHKKNSYICILVVNN